MPVPNAAGKPWEGMDWRDEGTPEWRDSLTDEQADEWRNWQLDSQAEAGEQAPDGGPEHPGEDGGEYQPPTDPAYQPGSGGPDAPSWDYDSLPPPQAAAPPAPPEHGQPTEPPSSAGKPWDGMDPLQELPPGFYDSLSEAEQDEWYKWKSYHEQKAQDEEDTQADRENEERNERIRREVEEETASGEIDKYGGPVGGTKTVAFVDDQGNQLDAVVKDQPIHIQVTVPRTEGEAPPETIDVVVSGPRLTFLAREYEGTDKVTLEWIGNVNGPAIYRSGLMTVDKGGEGVSSLDIGGFEFNTGGGMGGFSAANGDYIQVAIDGAHSGIQVFESTAKLEIALTLAAIQTAHQSYTNVLINVGALIEQVKTAPESPEKNDLLKQLTFTRDKAQQVVTLANKAIAHLDHVDALDHQHLAVLRLYATWMGLFREPTVNAAGKETTEFGPLYFPDPRVEHEHVKDVSDAAKEEVRRIFWAGLTQATIGGYRLLAQATMVAQIMTIFGTNEMGQKASGMERWMAFFDLLSQAALMGAMMKWNTSMATGTGLPKGVVPRTTGRIPKTTRVTDPKVAVKSPTGTPVAPEAAGMLRHAARDAQLIARKRDAVIQTRFTSPDAMVHRATGAAPKSALVKSKTIKDIDRLIGVPENSHNGISGFFPPKLPERGTMTDAEWAPIQERFDLRKAEYEGPTGQYQRKLAEKGEITFRDGMVCDKDGRPFAGDYDLFEITNRDGTPVSAEKYDAIVTDLMNAPGFEAAHGAHVRWDPMPYDEAYHLDISGDTQVALDAVGKWHTDRGIFEGILAQHQPGGDGLITFAPNQPPVITYAGEAVGPKFAELGMTPIAPSAAAGAIPFVRPTLYVATTQQLLDGRYPDGPGWEWTEAWNWPSEVANWQQKADALSQPIVIKTTVDTAPSVLTPTIAQQDSAGRNWRPIIITTVIGGALLLGVGSGYLFFNNQNATGPIVALATGTPSPTVLVTAPPTQGGIVLPPTQPVPTRTQAPETAAPPTLEPLLAGINAAILDGSFGLVDPPETWEPGVNYSLDLTGDLYLPNDGSAATAIQNYVDLSGTFGWMVELDGDAAAAISAHACGEDFAGDGGQTIHVACNQDAALEAGTYLLVMTTWAEPLPDPFPDAGQCVFSIQSDVDHDRTTGFQSGLPFNYLIGADVYYEDLFFVSATNGYQNYMLATDYSLPPRTDTGEIHGNLATTARVLEMANQLSQIANYQLWFWIGVDELKGDNWTAGGFCTTDRAHMGPTTLAVDALGDPTGSGFPDYFELPKLPQ